MKMKRFFGGIFSAAAVFFALAFTGCGEITPETVRDKASAAYEAATSVLEEVYSEVSMELENEMPEKAPSLYDAATSAAGEVYSDISAGVVSAVSADAAPVQTAPAETATAAAVPSVEKDGSYTSPEDVAEYIHTFGTLPSNFITKEEARALGWDGKAGNLWDAAYGKSIGGDYFGNYEGLLPEAEGRKYTECDVNYSGGYRGAERIVFSNDGLIFYTSDHYESFTQLY